MLWMPELVVQIQNWFCIYSTRDFRLRTVIVVARPFSSWNTTLYWDLELLNTVAQVKFALDKAFFRHSP